jgi:formate/nitrite transporter FocA (FNT family)
MTFVALGFEHSVANMFLIPHGMLNGATVGLDVINVWMCF